MTVLIVGESGYIGSKVSERLSGLADNHHPTAVIYATGRDYRDLGQYVATLEWMKENKVRRFVLTSSASVYGLSSGVIDETWRTAPVTPYGRFKLMCEQIANDYPVETVILRPFNVSGGMARFIPKVKEGKVSICGDGSAVRDFIHVDDVADAFVKALTAPTGVYNIGSGKGYSLKQIIALRGSVEVDYQPERPGDPKVLIADISKAKRLMGWEPKRTIEDILC